MSDETRTPGDHPIARVGAAGWKQVPALAARTIRIFGLIVLALLALLFIPARTVAFWQGWLFVLTLAACVGSIAAYFAVTNPAVIEHRLRAGLRAETRPVQKVVLSLMVGAYAFEVWLAGVDHRTHLSELPAWVAIAGAGIVAIGFLIVFAGLKVNAFAIATIKVGNDQTVINSGPYSIVRHPMYSGLLLVAVGTALALASAWALAPVVIIFLALIFRLLDEEDMLLSQLGGYGGYVRQVRWRLIPFVY